jgi:hypothetical protein
MFSSEESLNEVKVKLPKDVFNLESYILFISHIPFLKYLFQHFDNVICPGHCLVMLYMTVKAFQKFNNEVYVFIDEQISLRGYAEGSVANCNCCLDNSNYSESYTFHDLDCPFLCDLYPDLVRVEETFDVDKMLSQFAFDVPITRNSFLRSALVDEMHRAAVTASLKPNYGLVVPPKSDSLDKSDMMPSNKYVHARCCCIHYGEKFRRWLNREQSVQYCTLQGYILVDVLLDLFLPFHQVISTDVNSVSESYAVNREPGIIHNVYLSIIGCPAHLMDLNRLNVWLISWYQRKW